MRGFWTGCVIGGMCLTTVAATKIGPWTPEEFADRVNRLNRAYDRIAVGYSAVYPSRMVRDSSSAHIGDRVIML